ncbi:hypothetical protein ACSLBF_04030 [Pseudoalteromonas sp. T1lg65]|uniref:hypothetical protein n=1 Tax=Pseudoalteromonas sp. T1lg65 TaxID=2077101 RepID=UPI003F7B2591
MNELFKVVFVDIAANQDKEQAAELLATKLKTSPSKVQQFFDGRPLFAPTDKTKALKQVKLLSTMGINAKLVNQADNSTTQVIDQERIFEALDYITSSLIRIEERLEDIEQQISQDKSNTSPDETTSWQEDELFEELDFDAPMPTKSKSWLYYLLAVLIILFVLLGVSLFFPDWFALP